MATPSFFHPLLSSSEPSTRLSGDESLHAVKSRRLKVGSEVRLFNGKGLVGEATITAVERRVVSVNVSHLQQHDAPKYNLTIATALPKGDRQKVMLDMLTQLGVSEIIPIRCERSITRFNDNMTEKWHRLMIEACKQSQNPWLPTLKAETKLAELLNESSRTFVYADESGENAQTAFRSVLAATVLIGPEGGFSCAEFDAFDRVNASSLALGGHILRTEVAAVAAATQFNTFAGGNSLG